MYRIRRLNETDDLILFRVNNLFFLLLETSSEGVIFKSIIATGKTNPK